MLNSRNIVLPHGAQPRSSHVPNRANATCEANKNKQFRSLVTSTMLPRDHLLLLDRSPNIGVIGPLISRWELDKFNNCWNKSFRTSKILPLLYQQFSNLLNSKRDMSGPKLGALSNNRWLGVTMIYRSVAGYNNRLLGRPTCSISSGITRKF
jgi:hypothetical protein